MRALYLNGSAIQYADSYIRLAQGTGINAFVVDIVEGFYGGVLCLAGDAAVQPVGLCGGPGHHGEFPGQRAEAAGRRVHTIGRITVFNDAHLAADHPEYVISDLSGTPLKISSMYWPSAYNRTVWQYKTELALRRRRWGSTRSSSTTSASLTARTSTSRRGPSTTRTPTERARLRRCSGF